MNIHSIDIVVISCMLISLLIGYIRGLVHEVLSLASVLVSTFISIKCAPKIFHLSYNAMPNELLAKIISYFACFAISIILFSILTHICNTAIKKTSLKNIDRLFGALFGFARGIILCCAVEVFATSICANYNVSPDDISTKSYLYKYIYKTSNLVSIILPRKISEYIIEYVGEDRRIDILQIASSNNIQFNNGKRIVATKHNYVQTTMNNNSASNNISKLLTKKTKNNQITPDKRKKINKTITDIINEYAD